MKILMVSSYLPYPLTNGGHIRLFNLIKKLAVKYDITLICEMRSNQSKENIEVIEKYCKKVIAIPRKKQWSIGNVLRTGFSGNSFLVSGHTNDIFKERIIKLLEKERFDLLHIETFYVSQNVPDTSVPIVMVEHNIEYLVYKRYADRAPVFIRPLLYIDIYKMKLNEEKAWKRAQKLIAVTEEEKEIMKRPDTVVVPNGVDLESFKFQIPMEKKYHSVARRINLPEKEILFIGDFKWIQNRDSVCWILKDIWPYLLRSVENDARIKLRVVGRKIPKSIKELNIYDSVIFDEDASKDTYEIFRKADILLAPIRVGGGSSYKILEAMASGVPVVTTSGGMKGLDAISGKHLLVSDDVQGIVSKVAGLLRDTEQYEKIAVNARKLIEERYSWDVIVNRLDEVYTNLVNS